VLACAALAAAEPAPRTFGEDVKLARGTYRLDRPVRVTADGITLDLRAARFVGGTGDPSRFTGVGLVLEGRRDVTVRGGRFSGFRCAVLVKDCENVVREGVDVAVRASRSSACARDQRKRGEEDGREDPGEQASPATRRKRTCADAGHGATLGSARGRVNPFVTDLVCEAFDGVSLQPADRRDLRCGGEPDRHGWKVVRFAGLDTWRTAPGEVWSWQTSRLWKKNRPVPFNRCSTCSTRSGRGSW